MNLSNPPGATAQPPAPDKARSSGPNGRLWGARARHWAEIQEGRFSAAWDAVFDACGLGDAARCCDASARAVDDPHAQALAPFRQGDGGYRIGFSFRWLPAAH